MDLINHLLGSVSPQKDGGCRAADSRIRGTCGAVPRNRGCTAQCQFDASGCVSLADCGNGVCDGDQGETHGNCPQDCVGYVVLAAAVYHTCAVSTEGTAWCWGAGSYGQHGNGLWWEATSRPTPVSGGLSVTDIAAGSGGLDRGHSCAAAADGTVWCWGAGGDGQLGNGSRADSGVPVPVAGITNAVAVSAGDRFSCALTAESTVWCWGSGRHGSLGNGTESDSLTPVPVTSLADVQSLSSGGSYTHGGHSCVVVSEGTAWCWGGGSYGQLGDGATFDASTPVQVMGLPDVAMVSAGVTHSCAVASEGAAWCWGEGMFGKLGNGSESDAPTPVQVTGLASTAVIAAGGGHTCAVASGGTAWCWGTGDSGRLGNGALVGSPTPVQVADLSGLVDLHAGDAHTCAVASDGTGWCWGFGAQGELGDSRQLGIDWPSYSDTPVQVTPPF